MIRARANFDQAVRVIGGPIVDLCFGMADDSRAPTNSAVVEASYVATDSTGAELVFDYSVTAVDNDNEAFSSRDWLSVRTGCLIQFLPLSTMI